MRAARARSTPTAHGRDPAWRRQALRWVLALGALVIASGAHGQAAPTAPIAPTDASKEPSTALPLAVVQAMQALQIPTTALSVEVIDLDRASVAPTAAASHRTDAPPPRLAHLAAVPRNPASLMKLYTTHAALVQRGPDFRWRTPIWFVGRVSKPGGRDTLDGDLVLRAAGDPTLVMERLWGLLREVQQAGVRDIRGDIVLDRTAFAPDQQPPAAFDDQPERAYNVRPDALVINFKALVLHIRPDTARGVARVGADPPLEGLQLPASVPLSQGGACGSSALRAALQPRWEGPRLRLLGSFPATCGERQVSLADANPASFNARAIAGLWREMGGVLRGRVREGSAPREGVPGLIHASPPLADVVRDINRHSNNLMAEMLFLTLARPLSDPIAADMPLPPPADAATARRVLAELIEVHTGCRAPEVLVDNGSGLSRDGRTSVHCLARWIEAADRSPTGAELQASLPLAGADRGDAAPGTGSTGAGATALGAGLGHAHLKTGTLDDSVGLAGWVLGRSGRRYALAAIINHPRAASARRVLEMLVDWTAQD